jgi:hypothetical protein
MPAVSVVQLDGFCSLFKTKAGFRAGTGAETRMKLASPGNAIIEDGLVFINHAVSP